MQPICKPPLSIGKGGIEIPIIIIIIIIIIIYYSTLIIQLEIGGITQVVDIGEQISLKSALEGVKDVDWGDVK